MSFRLAEDDAAYSERQPKTVFQSVGKIFPAPK
jgi:hypothetical protein